VQWLAAQYAKRAVDGGEKKGREKGRMTTGTAHSFAGGSFIFSLLLRSPSNGFHREAHDDLSLRSLIRDGSSHSLFVVSQARSANHSRRILPLPG